MPFLKKDNQQITCIFCKEKSSMGEKSRNSNDKDYYFDLGIRELDSGNFDKAIYAFEKAIPSIPCIPST